MAILGVDVGGTFTDFYLVADGGSVRVYKRPSTPGEPARAILDGLVEMGVAPSEVVHGSTVATNAIIERKGARTALITTRGFRDALLIGRQTRPRLYDLSPRREAPLVPDDLRFEADERVDHHGEVLQALDPAEVEALLDRVQAAGVESLAVCFLFSFLNQAHEQMVAEAARHRGLTVSASHEVLPEHREFERTSTTVANAYVAPVMSRYLGELERELRGRGVGRLRVMVSSGGSASAEAAGRLAVRTAVSGPAGGVAGAFALASEAGFGRIITLDMGGTSTDVSLCPGRVLERDETMVGAFPVRGPTVDVLSVGAGGGSIARIDEGGALRVGPESAGADPGPACYGRGEAPAVTDAHVVLGRVVPEHFLGGRMELRPELSLGAMGRVASAFGDDAHAAAAAILRVANANMERALRVVSVERGYDPRDFTLVPFGGAGPLHACELAGALRIQRVLVPLYPGVLSALGMATAPVVKDASAAVMQTFGDNAAPAGAQSFRGRTPLPGLFAELEARARQELVAEGFSGGQARVQRFLEMRYRGQSYELSVDVKTGEPAEFVPLFHRAHRERYSHADESRPVEVVTARVRLSLPSPAPGKAAPAAKGAPAPHPMATRAAYFQDGGRVRETETAFYDRQVLTAGASFAGPAVVVQMDSTTVVPPGWRATADPYGNLLLEIA